MIYLSGCIRRDLVGTRPDLGVIVTPLMGNKIDYRTTAWAADNGCFTRPGRFDAALYLAWLEHRSFANGNCLFVTAPDVVGDSVATWNKSAPILPRIRMLGFRAALVAQDGISIRGLEWDAFDVLFIGGTTQWKISSAAKDITCAAKEHKKWVHMGRVNSLSRLRTAAMWGCDSADGTFLAFGPDKNTPRLLAWLNTLHHEPMLNFGVAA